MTKTSKRRRKSRLVMVLPDLHVPHHDPAALGCVLKAYEALRPEEVVVLGDWLDCEAFSSHPRSSMGELIAHRFIDNEVAECVEILDSLQKYRNHLAFVEGNHEQRVERWAAALGNDLGKSLYELISPAHLLSKGRSNFTWVGYTSELAHYEIAPDLWALHGWSFAKNAARIHLDRAITVSIVYGHTHRQQSESRRDPATGRILKSWSPGCLSKLQPIYRQNMPTTWVHGFSLVYVGESGWTEYTITIDRGSCVLPDGTEIKA